MIESIEFSNYRIFALPQKLRLAPITVIFGKNNTGKSAILKLPLLINSALKGDSAEVFSKKINEVRICDEYRDVIYKKGSKAIKLKLISTNQDTLEVSFYVDASDKALQTHIEEWILTTSDGQQIKVCRNDDNELQTEEGTKVRFMGFIPQEGIENRWIKILQHFDESVDYLEAIRELPIRDYRLQDSKVSFVGPKGEHAYDHIINDEELREKVSAWYENTFDGWQVSIDKTHDPVFYIELQQQDIKNNILDTGAGIVQSMPVIIALGMNNDDGARLNIVEEPETHLHPAAHATMAEYIATEIKRNLQKRILIETHSLNFILRLRLMVAKGELNPNDIALYYVEFDKMNKGSNLKEVNIKEDGNVSDWPQNVFNESLEEALKLRTAQMQRK